MLKVRIRSRNRSGPEATNQAQKLDSLFLGKLIAAVVNKDEKDIPIMTNGTFEVRFEEIEGLAVEKCIEDSGFEPIDVCDDAGNWLDISPIAA